MKVRRAKVALRLRLGSHPRWHASCECDPIDKVVELDGIVPAQDTQVMNS